MSYTMAKNREEHYFSFYEKMGYDVIRRGGCFHIMKNGRIAHTIFGWSNLIEHAKRMGIPPLRGQNIRTREIYRNKKEAV